MAEGGGGAWLPADPQSWGEGSRELSFTSYVDAHDAVLKDFGSHRAEGASVTEADIPETCDRSLYPKVSWAPRLPRARLSNRLIQPPVVNYHQSQSAFCFQDFTEVRYHTENWSCNTIQLSSTGNLILYFIVV